ncbi:MAG: Gfo/Idh/MocA family oxidoreductase [Clostridia bacterium]|nr:Gfo/Idh/MocA family oxidoreductase [Clostridia bacterium]
MKTYALVGTGYRGLWSYCEPIVKDFADTAKLVAVCDINPLRAKLVGQYLKTDIPAYTDFDLMLKEHKPDTVIVTTKDCAHETYICRALEAGCDVISEKPLTTDEKMLSHILTTEQKTGHKVTVTFNCRFMDFYVKIKELVAGGLLGEVYSAHYEWLLDTSHGADYFRRWHSIRANSGSLLIHKCTHHFDLLNWYLDDEPVKVNAFGTRRFYGDDRRPHGERCLTCPYKRTCEFYQDIDKEDGGRLAFLYKNCEEADGYIRDRCLFSSVIDIEDSVSVNIRYAKGAVVSYSLTAHSPYECMKLVLNGEKGRLECDTALGQERILFYDRDGQCVNFDRSHVKPVPGGHGGSDPALRERLFRGYSDDPLCQMADTRAGAMSIGIGIAANISMREDRAVYLGEFLGSFYPELKA